MHVRAADTVAHAAAGAFAQVVPDAPPGPLIDSIWTADPSGHVWDGTLWIYPSHDEDTGATADDHGSHYDMRDYHVLSLDSLDGEVVDHGVALTLEQVPWAARQLWAPDAARRGDTYYLYFPAKDRDGVFRIGVATAEHPAGPFTAQPEPIPGAYSIDPAVFTDDDGSSYLVTGGILGGQLQRWRDDVYTGVDAYPGLDEPALAPRIARLSDDLLSLAEPTRPLVLVDDEGRALTSRDPNRFFEGAWISKVGDTYVFMYSNGDSHQLVHATGDSPYGPFTYRGVLLEPVIGWTTHGSIVEWHDAWYLLYHDAERSGRDHLRTVRMARLDLRPDGTFATVRR
ncbi:glycoside hydrolase family 43 protein [Cellulomonas sp. CW35]|uniref:Alpha-N-arabinofuranosidase n=1 Tax=Cellulomonas uda TaxID=1714 RepID=A0A4Y3KDK1_CELUD|nr:glycoside hydrolase family 43 protein [Cellulomonas uda]NII66078.1 hypothetical protein [Cellulomonas uda]GEA82521.1 alpha-N-arabinofuranosidase [Cellulomonas uda]